MPDSDIPKGFKGKFTFIAFEAGKTGGSAIIREAEFDAASFEHSAADELDMPVRVTAAINGLSDQAAIRLNMIFDTLYKQGLITRKLLLQALKSNEN